MRTEELLAQAQDCRRWAPELAGRPDALLLLKLADTFEQLANEQRISSSEPDDLPKQ